MNKKTNFKSQREFDDDFPVPSNAEYNWTINREKLLDNVFTAFSSALEQLRESQVYLNAVLADDGNRLLDEACKVGETAVAEGIKSFYNLSNSNQIMSYSDPHYECAYFIVWASYETNLFVFEFNFSNEHLDEEDASSSTGIVKLKACGIGVIDVYDIKSVH